MDRQDLNAEIPRNANHQNLDNETRLLAYDYIDYRLQQNDLEWPNRPADSIPDPPTPLMLVMRATCDHFNERWFQRYGEMDEHIAASLPVLNSEGVEQAFANVSDALFRPNEVGDIEITWGRIFCIFAFGGSLAVHCAQQGTPELIDQVTEHLVTFATTRLLDWIASKGGWEAFPHLQDQRRNAAMMNSLKTTARVGAVCGALGIAALAALIVCRH